MIGKWFARRRVRSAISGCDFEYAIALIRHLLGGGVIPTELANLLDKFIANPSYDTAADLVLFDERFLHFFQLSLPTSPSFIGDWPKIRRKPEP